MASSVDNPDPRFHTERIRHEIEQLITHLRDDTQQVSEQKAKVLFETAAEMLGGLQQAFSHYQQGSEEAMRP